MRPRVFPAEDDQVVDVDAAGSVRFNEAAGIPRGRHALRRTPVAGAGASMRPRVFPAEDDWGAEIGSGLFLRFNEAAGIPRGRRSNGRWPRPAPSCFNEAAGIPRGRHHRSPARCPSDRRCFNEAAGIPRGRLAAPPLLARRRQASMRPRVFPAEDARLALVGIPVFAGFNEAAGIPRGRPWRGARAASLCHCFNEAAGIPRGRHTSGSSMSRTA